MMEVYYAEDDPNIADIVKKYLEQKQFKVTICGTLAELRQAIQNHVPTLVLLDWNTPDGYGDGLCQWIRRNWQELPVIFLTVCDDSCDIVAGFQSGADDYVVKPFELAVLYSRIQALLRRSGNMEKQYLDCNGISMDLSRRQVFYSGEEITLSSAEYQVLLCLMQNKGRTITREKILEQVWDVHGNYVNDNTLTVTMKRLRDKLHQPVCLKTVRSVGYRMEDIKCLPFPFALSRASIRMFGAGLRSRRLGLIIRYCRAMRKIRSIICGEITGETTTSMEVCSSRQTVFWENRGI